MITAPTILLVGYRASGKSSLGWGLARVLERPFIDLDDRVRASFDGAASVAGIWATFGEAAFRSAEAAALAEALDHGEPAVIALGGGTLTIGAAREAIARAREAGRIRVVYLAVPAEVLRRRLRSQAGDRPSLTGPHPADEVDAVLREREADYRAAADIILDVDPEETAIETLERLTTSVANENASG